MTRAEEIRAGLAEPVELLRSKSGCWHLFNERLDERLARTSCIPTPRIVMVGKLVMVTGLDIAYWREPLPQPSSGGKTCRECEWTEAAFGTAWPLVIAECVLRALEGIRNDDLPKLAEEWGLPPAIGRGADLRRGVSVRSVLNHLTSSYLKTPILRWEHGPYSQGQAGRDSYHDGTWYPAAI